MFEKAARLKFRFDSPKGQLTVEDLWDLPLTSQPNRANLDDIARSLNKQLKSGDDVSFVTPERKSDPTLQMRFDVVKHIIDVKIAENKAHLEAKDRAEKKQHILSIYAERQDEHLRAKSLEELEKVLAEL